MTFYENNESIAISMMKKSHYINLHVKVYLIIIHNFINFKTFQIILKKNYTTIIVGIVFYTIVYSLNFLKKNSTYSNNELKTLCYEHMIDMQH
jgi:hypothetical protein